MNLLSMMKREVSILKLTDELEIAYYLYMRMGQIFYYDASYMFLELKEKEKYSYPKQDIQNIDNLNKICFELSDIMVDLLHNFGINAKKKEVKKGDCKHAFVLLFPKDENATYKMDLTVNYDDITLLKLGLRANHFTRMYEGEIITESPTESKIEQIENKFYKKGIKNQNILIKVKEKNKILTSLKKILIKKMGNNNIANQEYDYQVYRMVMNILNEIPYDLGYVSGAKCISYLLKYFKGKEETSNITYFYNHEKKDFMEIHSLMHNGEPCYFCYHKMTNGKYEFQEVPKIYIENLKKNYITQYIEKLLMSKPNYYENSLSAETQKLSVN